MSVSDLDREEEEETVVVVDDDSAVNTATSVSEMTLSVGDIGDDEDDSQDILLYSMHCIMSIVLLELVTDKLL